MIIFTSTIESYVPYVTFAIAAFVIVIIILLVFVMINQHIVSDYFASKKFNVRSKHKIEPLTGDEKFELHVFNNNVNEARILSFGFLYRSNSVDFFRTYLDSKGLKADSKVIILSRDFISLEISRKVLEDMIRAHNGGKVRVETIYAFVTDSSGNMIKYSAKEVRKIIGRHFQEIETNRKAVIAAEKKAKREKAAQARKAAFDAFLAKVKALFTRKPKSPETTVTAVVDGSEVKVEEVKIEKPIIKEKKAKVKSEVVETPVVSEKETKKE